MRQRRQEQDSLYCQNQFCFPLSWPLFRFFATFSLINFYYNRDMLILSLFNKILLNELIIPLPPGLNQSSLCSLHIPWCTPCWWLPDTKLRFDVFTPPELLPQFFLPYWVLPSQTLRLKWTGGHFPSPCRILCITSSMAWHHYVYLYPRLKILISPLSYPTCSFPINRQSSTSANFLIHALNV